jgi:hypothetical protein
MSRKHKPSQKFVLERIFHESVPENYFLVIMALFKVLTDKFKYDVRRKRLRQEEEDKTYDSFREILLNMYLGLQKELNNFEDEEGESSQENTRAILGNILGASQNIGFNDSSKIENAQEFEDGEEEEEEITEEEYNDLIEDDDTEEDKITEDECRDEANSEPMNEVFTERYDEKKPESENSSVVSIKNVSVQSSCTTQYDPEEDEEVCQCEHMAAKLPVVLSQLQVEFFVEANVSLSEPALKLKNQVNRIILGKCYLVPSTDKLFLSGIIQQQIQYSTAECIKQNSINGKIKNVTVDIPFKCSTKVSFSTRPIVSEAFQAPEAEASDLEPQIINISERNNEHLEFSNEQAYCQLDGMETSEISRREKIKYLEDTLHDSYTFENIKKKIFVTLEVSLLQDQYVFIPKA